MYKTTLRKTDGTEYTVDTYNGLTEQTTTTQSTHAPKEIFYGGVPKTGSMKIDDPQREIVDKVLDGTFDLSDTTVKTYYNDKLQGVFKTSDSDYEENSGELSVSLVDNISNWDKIQFAGRDYSLRADDAIKPNLYEILSYVLMTTLKWNASNTVMQSDVNVMCSLIISVNMGDVIEDMTVMQYLQRIIIPYDYLPADNLRSTVDKICTVAQLNYAETNKSGGVYPKNIRFFNARPAKARSEDIIAISPTSQNIFPTRDVLLKNKYDTSQINFEQVNLVTNYGETVYEYNSSDFSNLNLYIGNTGTDRQANIEPPGSSTLLTTFATKLIVYIYYKTFSFKFPKLSNHNLEKITAVNYGSNTDGTPYTTFSVSATMETGSAIANNVSYVELTGSDIVANYEKKISQNTPILETYYSETQYIDEDGYDYYTQAKINFEHSNIATATQNTAAYEQSEDEDYYYISNLKLPVQYTQYILHARGQLGNNLENKTNWTGTCQRVIPNGIVITVNGGKNKITFQGTVSTNNQNKNVATIEGNTLLQDKAFISSLYADKINNPQIKQGMTVYLLNSLYGEDNNGLWSNYSFDSSSGQYYAFGYDTSFNNLAVGTTYYGKRNSDGGIDEVTITSGNATDGYELSITSHYVSYDEIGSVVDRLSNSILSDYANGVSTCTTEITLDQLKYIDGTIAKQASEGEIIHIGDVVRLDRNSFGDSIYNYADGNPYLWRVTGTTLIYDGYPHQKLELQEITSGNRGLKYMSWETIESIANSGQAQNVFSIGDEKEIELSTGEKLTAVIIGFNHDKISDTKKAGITFFIKTPLATNYKMNSNQGVSTYWGSCSLRTTLLNDIKNTLPGWDDEEGVISANNLIKRLKPVQKKIFDYNDSVQTLTDDLFLLSAYEIGNSLGNVVWAQEGTQYAYFADNDNSVRALKNTDGVSVEWWTCSLGKKSTTTYREQYIYRNKTGALFSTSNQTYSKAVAFAFCIGEVDA